MFLRELHIVFHNDCTFPSKEHKDSNFSTFWPTLLICCLFDNSHPNRGEVILICSSIMISWASQVAQQGSYSNAGDPSSIPGWRRSPGGGHGNPLQYSCLENPHGQRSLAGYSSWSHKEMDMTERSSTAQHMISYVEQFFIYLYIFFKKMKRQKTDFISTQTFKRCC